MKYRTFAEAVEGAIDQASRGMDNHEYELHIKRLRKYQSKIYDLEDCIEILNEDKNEKQRLEAKKAELAKYRAKLEAEKKKGV